MRKSRGHISLDVFHMIGCFFLVGIVTVAFLIAWGLCALIRWLF
jgi:hypothetical protein